MSLIPGQIVRYEHRLWRVDHVNYSRAYIVPLGKVKIDTEGAGVSVSPGSPLEIITDIQRARDEIELEAAERELAEVRSALAGAERAEAKATAAPRLAQRPTLARKPGGWRVGPKPTPAFREGSLAAVVLACIKAAPGLTTKDLVGSVKAEGNVAACISRFAQAGIIEKS